MVDRENGPVAEQATGPEIRQATRLRRSTTDKMVAGVCGGLGAYFGVDPAWFRLTFVVLTFGGGSGILIYIVAWILMPEQREDEQIGRGPSSIGEYGPVLVGIALVALGLMLLIDNFVPWFDRLMWPLVVLSAGGALIYTGLRRDRS